MPKKNSTKFFLFGSLILAVLFMCAVTTRKVVGPASCRATSLLDSVDRTQTTAFFEGNEVKIPSIALASNGSHVLGVSTEERWIEVDISDQKLKAWDGSTLFLEAPISGGLPWYPTPKGEFRIMYKSRAQKMEGGVGKYYYYLPNVPYVMFFGNDKLPWSRGYSLHGAYWHNEFGTPRSHGCVNLQIPVAERLYYWTSPVVPEGKGSVRADEGNLGTRVVIHE